MYVKALVREILSYKELGQKYKVSSIFLGGGTPSILQGEQIEAIMEAIYKVFMVREGAEITIEVNPGSVTKERLLSYQKSKINRISFGLQSTHKNELEILGRIHSYDEFLYNYQLARDLGFVNINVDLMSAIPEQTIGSWEKNLERILKLRPEHISAYSLIIEEGTPFYKMDLSLPKEGTERQMYHLTNEKLGGAGYTQYEVSNYSLPGYECNHNIGYWTRKNYLGLGLGAASLLENVRFHNLTDFREYCNLSFDHNHIQEDKEKLSVTACMEEFMFLGLRMNKGVSKEQFRITFATSMESVYGQVLRELEEKLLICIKGDQIALTKQGVDLSNYVLADFLL